MNFTRLAGCMIAHVEQGQRQSTLVPFISS
jgi:hypothetical protein